MKNIKGNTQVSIKQNNYGFKLNATTMPKFNVISKIEYYSPTLQELTKF